MSHNASIEAAHTAPPQAPEPSARAAELLDAAEECFLKFGLTKTTMEDVARAAGASRATLYRHFANRDDLFLGVVEREAARMAAEAKDYLARFDTVGDWIVEGLLFCMREIPGRPLLSMAVGHEESATASRLVLGSDRLRAVGVGVLRPMFEPAREQGLLEQSVEIEVLMEWVLRVLVSYLTVPSPLADSEQRMRELLHAMLLPAVLTAPGRENVAG